MFAVEEMRDRLGDPEMPTASAMVEMIDAVDTKHDDAHKRLRADLEAYQEECTAKLEHLRDIVLANQNKLAELEQRPIDAAKLVATPRVVIGIVGIAVSVFGGAYAAGAGIRSDVSMLRSDVRDISTRMQAQHDVSEANANAQRSTTSDLQRAIDEIRKEQAQQNNDIQKLNDAVAALVGRRGK